MTFVRVPSSLIALLLFIPSLAHTNDQVARPVAQTSVGSVRGITENSLNVFKGIPFAEPPVGALRFQPPQPKKPARSGIDAAQFGAACMQPSFSNKRMSEDCLYLNVWAPRKPGRYPVMIWIHGGANITGATSLPDYDGSTFAQDGIVFVSVSYRLGAFGFLELGDALGAKYRESANNGLRDLILSLQWVHQNISAFGGDPSQVTVAGESAGAQNLAALLVSPLSKDLFQRAIVDSQGGSTRTFAESEALTQRFLTAAHLPTKNPTQLLTLPAQQILQAQLRTAPHPLLGPTSSVTGGQVLPQTILEAARNGATKDKVLIISTNQDEAESFLVPETNEENFHQNPLVHMTTPEMVAVLGQYKTLFPDLSSHDRLMRWATAAMFWMPALQLAESHIQNGGRLWMYRFEYTAKNGRFKGYAAHAADLPYVFDHLQLSGESDERTRSVSDDEAEIARLSHGIWSAFVRTGEPQRRRTDPWPTFVYPERITFIIDESATWVPDPNQKERLLWAPKRSKSPASATVKGR